MKAAIYALLLLSFGGMWWRLESAPFDTDSPYVEKADVLFFFDSISFSQGNWRFKLSDNSIRLLWRTIDGDRDATGVCDYEQTLIVPKSASLEIKGKDVGVLLQPVPPGVGRTAAFTVSIRFGRGKKYSIAGETLLDIDKNGHWRVGTGID